jgi:hypothetical protein
MVIKKSLFNIVIRFGILVLVAVVLVLSLAHPIYHYQKARCRERLMLLENALTTFRSDHQNQLPHSLGELSNELVLPAFLICPGSRHTPGGFTNADSWADYRFIDWSATLGTNVIPNDFPIIYDRSLNNHGGRGVNVLLANGVVQWDPGAARLRKFAMAHPNANLPLPE